MTAKHLFAGNTCQVCNRPARQLIQFDYIEQPFNLKRTKGEFTAFARSVILYACNEHYEDVIVMSLDNKSQGVLLAEDMVNSRD